MKHSSLSRPMLVEVLSALAVVTLSLSALSGWHGIPTWHISGTVETVCRVILFVLGIVFLAIAIAAAISRRLRKVANHPQGRQGADVYQPDLTYLFRLQKEASDYASNPSIPLFIELVTSMETYRRRVVETVLLDGRTLRQATASEFALPDNVHEALKSGLPSINAGKEGAETAGPDGAVKQATVYVPVLNPRKTELVDGFALRGLDDKTLTTLSYDETVRLAAYCLRFLFRAYLNSSADGAGLIDPSGGLTGKAKQAETLLLQVIAKRGVVKRNEVTENIAKALEYVNLTAPASDPANGFGNDKDRLARFTTHLGITYPIVAVLQGDLPQRFRISYERTLIPKPFIPRKSKDDGKYVKERARLILGLRPYQIAIPTANAFSTQSYHLIVQGPDGQYLMEQFLRCSQCRTLVLPGWTFNKDAHPGECTHSDSDHSQAHYFRLRRKRGQNYAHVYMRGFASSRLKDIELLTRFGEIPPGTLGSGLLTSLLATLVIAVIGHLTWMGPGAAGTPAELPTGVPALMLALPAVAASWFGLKSSDDSLLRCALASRISLIVTGVLSIWIAIIYLSNPTPQAAKPPFIGLYDVPIASLWGAIMLAASINSLYIGSTFVVRFAYYMKLLRRSDKDTATGSKNGTKEGKS
jgi:hypothetical protein